MDIGKGASVVVSNLKLYSDTIFYMAQNKGLRISSNLLLDK